MNQIFYDVLLCLSLASIPAAFSYLLDYALGYPGAEQFNTRSILFRYSLRMAKKRLIRSRRYQQFTDANTDTPAEFVDMALFAEARKFFTWESVVGMCMFCTNFWLAVLAAVVLFFFLPMQILPEGFYFLLIPIFSHTILRKL